jgi:hypothetical protein
MRCFAPSAVVLASLVGVGCGSSSDAGGSPDETDEGGAFVAAAGGGGGANDGGGKAGGGNSGVGGSAGTGGKGGIGGSVGTGGGVNTGGSVGTGGTVRPDAGPHVVRACPGADGATGTWEDITPPDVSLDPSFNTGAGKNYGTNSFVMNPQDRATIYLGTSAMGVYKTTDCGATWAHINTGANAETMDKGRQWTMVIDPVDPEILYTVSGYGTNGLFKTTNGGVDWQQILAPDVASVLQYGGFIARIKMDPTDHNHLLVSPHFNCNPPHSASCMIETEDGGTTWKVIENTPPAVEGSGMVMVDRKTWFWAQGFGGLWRTADQGATWTRVAQANGYAYDSLYQSPQGTYYMPAAFNVITSPDGISWSTLAGTSNVDTITGSTTKMYTTHGSCVGSSSQPYQPFAYAAVSDPTAWKTLASPMRTYGGGDLQYDEDHHILYSSACLGGFWRVVTQ